jgi:hypothetical protein
MKAAELVGCAVYDADGALVGHVHDLKFVCTGRPGSPGWSCRLAGLSCGTVGVGHRLGYGTGDMAGPWPLGPVFRWLRRHSVIVDWGDIAECRPPTITLRLSRSELRQDQQ